MHTPECNTPRQFTQSASLAATTVFGTEPTKADPTLLAVPAAIRRGFCTIGGAGVKCCWMIDDVCARLISRGQPLPYDARYGTLYFAQANDGGSDAILLTFAEYPATQAPFGESTVIP